MVGGWVIALVVLGSLGRGLDARLTNGGYDVPGSDSLRAQHVQAAAFPTERGTTVYVALFAAHGHPIRLKRDVTRVANQVRQVAFVSGTARPVVDADRTIVVLPVQLRLSLDEAQKHLGQIRRALASGAPPRLRRAVLGNAASLERYSVVGKQDLTRAERFTIPVTLAILLAAFVSLVAAAVPFMLALAALSTTFGVLYLLSLGLHLSVFVTNSALLLGLGLSIDFSLFMVTGFRELLADGVPVSEAVTETLTTVGRAVVISALTVSAALASLLLVGVGLFDSMAIGASLAVLVAAAAALTLVPAVLRLIGHRINRFQLRAPAQAAARARVWHWLGEFVVRRRVVVAAGCLAVLVPLSLLAFGVHSDMRGLSVLPRTDSLRRADAIVSTHFGWGTVDPVEVFTRGDVRRVATTVGDQRGVRQVVSVTRGRGGWTEIRAVLRDEPDSPSAAATIKRLRMTLARTAPRQVLVGGLSAMVTDFTSRLARRTPLVMAAAIGLDIAILLIAFQSLVIPIKAVVTTLLSVGATLGILRLIFQDLDGTRLPYFVPLFLFAIVFGLSTDYEVFLLSRMRESFLSGASTDTSVRDGLVRSGRSITLAGAILITVFVGLGTSQMLPFRQLGIGLAVAILLDVTLVRGLLVPAAVSLFGERNWWLPGRHVREVATVRQSTREEQFVG